MSSRKRVWTGEQAPYHSTLDPNRHYSPGWGLQRQKALLIDTIPEEEDLHQEEEEEEDMEEDSNDFEVLLNRLDTILDAFESELENVPENADLSELQNDLEKVVDLVSLLVIKTRLLTQSWTGQSHGFATSKSTTPNSPQPEQENSVLPSNQESTMILTSSPKPCLDSQQSLPLTQEMESK